MANVGFQIFSIITLFITTGRSQIQVNPVACYRLHCFSMSCALSADHVTFNDYLTEVILGM